MDDHLVDTESWYLDQLSEPIQPDFLSVSVQNEYSKWCRTLPRKKTVTCYQHCSHHQFANSKSATAFNTTMMPADLPLTGLTCAKQHSVAWNGRLWKSLLKYIKYTQRTCFNNKTATILQALCRSICKNWRGYWCSKVTAYPCWHKLVHLDYVGNGSSQWC